MKTRLTVLVVLMLLSMALAGCRSTNDVECQAAWGQVYKPGDLERGTVIQLVMNNEWPTASVGHYLKDCLNEGWLPR